MTVLYKLETFEGPLDLLLHLIDKAEIDIQQISISEITEQYMTYLQSMQELELEVTSEFLVMAATLLSIKSKLLLPKPPIMEMDEYDFYEEEELDPREDLIRRLTEYRKYKSIAGLLHEKEHERGRIYIREPEDLAPFLPEESSNPLEGLHMDDLVSAFQRALARVDHKPVVSTIRRDEISVRDRIGQLEAALRNAGPGGRILFSSVLNERMYRQEIVVTFLAVLELMKMKQVSCYQDQLFDDIVMEWRGETASNGFADVEIDY
ncbi:ScpA family protein [Saccharibacillus sp. JS10]|uniref:segregation and condensation protein A n=1 Tax=Saccharibacillus sp. JS10 TaxID=2950552 RepID=UPI00210D5F77|nr:segregation/condensation protein A [Saccharibacillus sp. JS10]MCQ4085826.1 segregation/condensation protein A [Saccharibacillus sp. JS10]